MFLGGDIVPTSVAGEVGFDDRDSIGDRICLYSMAHNCVCDEKVVVWRYRSSFSFFRLGCGFDSFTPLV